MYYIVDVICKRKITENWIIHVKNLCLEECEFGLQWQFLFRCIGPYWVSKKHPLKNLSMIHSWKCYPNSNNSGNIAKLLRLQPILLYFESTICATLAFYFNCGGTEVWPISCLFRHNNAILHQFGTNTCQSWLYP